MVEERRMLHVEFWMASHFPIIMDGEAGHTSRLSPAKNPSIFKNVTFLGSYRVVL